MSMVRALVTAPLLLTHTYTVDEQPVAATGPVTATIRRLDGTAVGAPIVADNPSTGVYTIAPTPSQVLDTWTIDWAATINTVATVVRDVVEWAGGFLFDLAAARARPTPIKAVPITTEILAGYRIIAENDAERLTHTTWVPRYKRVAVSGSGNCFLILPHKDIRTIRSVKLDGTAWSADQIASLYVEESGVVEWPGGWWPRGNRNAVFEYEHGLDYCDPVVGDAAAKHMRALCTTASNNGPVPANAISFTQPDGGTYRISTPSADRIGIPEVDGIYARWGDTVAGGFA